MMLNFSNGGQKLLRCKSNVFIICISQNRKGVGDSPNGKSRPTSVDTTNVINAFLYVYCVARIKYQIIKFTQISCQNTTATNNDGIAVGIKNQCYN